MRLEAELGALTVAPLYLTEAVSPIAQAPYLNTVVIGGCSLEAAALLQLTQRIEVEFGRERGPGKSGRPAGAPRTLDLDLLLLEREVRSAEAPILPHPRLRERRFVLAPLCEIAPGWRIPPDDTTACELLARLPENPWARRLPEALRRLAGPARP